MRSSPEMGSTRSLPAWSAGWDGCAASTGGSSREAGSCRALAVRGPGRAGTAALSVPARRAPRGRRRRSRMRRLPDIVTLPAARGQPSRAAAGWRTSPARAPRGRSGASRLGVMASHYDVVVLGAGPGGYVAAIRAAQLGLSVAVVEEKYWGGVCLNVGCIPSKALLRNAELAHIFQHDAKTFGISGEVSFDFGAAFDRSRTVAEGRVKGVHFLMKKNKITEYDGRGTFRDAHTLDVKLADGSTDQVTFDNVIIATGSKVRLLPGV